MSIVTATATISTSPPGIDQTGSGSLGLTLNLTPLPEPATMGLACVAAPLMLRRRRT